MRQTIIRWGALLIGALLFLGDRTLKTWFFQSDVAVDLISGWVRLEAVWNEGIAFSLPLSPAIALGAVWVLIIGLVAAMICFWKRQRLNQFIALTMILFGASSNLWDRLQWGAILDYLRIWKFSVLNLADILILTGFLFFIFLKNHETIPKKG